MGGVSTLRLGGKPTGLQARGRGFKSHCGIFAGPKALSNLKPSACFFLDGMEAEPSQGADFVTFKFEVFIHHT